MPPDSAPALIEQEIELEYKPHTAVERRALDLLGSGVGVEAVASAVGVTPSTISQLLANEEFSKAVSLKRYQYLAANNQRDEKYNTLEDKLLVKLEKSLPLMIRPAEITKALATVNGCKRRGQNAPDTTPNDRQTIVNLIIPIQIAQKFTTNVKNQVVSAGGQDLLTMSSATLLKRAEAKAAETKELESKPPDPLLEELGG